MSALYSSIHKKANPVIGPDGLYGDRGEENHWVNYVRTTVNLI